MSEQPPSGEPTDLAATRVDDSSETRPARARLGRYRVLRVLGEGGMGIVYAAYDDELARAVAIKLVLRGSSPASSSARARMRREAQAMAQLSHPNVVQIFDVGEHDGELFLAMELIRGQTLDAWLDELGPGDVRATRWRTIVEVFVAAGRGLAAAHTAGLVHRDFKPSNVLVGDDVVKVVDFGLAHGDIESSHGDDADSPGEDSGHSVDKLAERVTQTGALVGTPAYLAPEQMAERTSSAASDQFAFCVALHEALTGRRPFGGTDFATLAANVLAGRRQTAPAASALPRWLLDAIDRGLAREPSERWPSMDALLAALLDDPARRRRRRLAVGLTALGLVAAAGGLGLRELRHRSECEALGSVLHERWDAQTKQQLADAFTSTDAPDPAKTWARVETRLDAWADAWRTSRMEACDQSREDPSRAQQRAACLEHERWEIEALLDVFETAERTTVIEAVTAVADLPDVDRCDDRSWLASDASLQSDGPGAADEGIALRRELARVLALERAGRFEEALDLASRSVESARSLEDPVAEAEALAKLGGIRWRMTDFAQAEQDLLAAHFLAGRVEHAPVAYATARDLAWVVGTRLARPKEGRIWLEHARLNLRRSGQDPEVEAELFERLGELEAFEGHHAEALAEHERALALREQQLGAGHPAIAESLLTIGWLQGELGDERAIATLERARELAVASLGPDHPTVAIADNQLGVVLYGLGRIDQSVTALRRAVATRERALGPDDTGLATMLSGLAAVLQAQGEPLESLLLLERSVGIFERTLGPDNPQTFSAKSNYATAKAEFGQIDDAIASLRETVAAAERVLSPEDPMLATLLTNLAYYLTLRGDHLAALPLRQRVVELNEARLGPAHIELAEDLDALFESLVATGQLDAALTSARRALAIRDTALDRGDVEIADSHTRIAIALLGLDRVDEAVEQHRHALEIRVEAGQQPGDSDALTDLRERLARVRGEPSMASPSDPLSSPSP